MGVVWRVRESDPELSQQLARKLSISNELSRILAARGFTDAGSARAFLIPRLDNLHDPFLFKDMEKASRRILRAVMNREKILIHGDYDVDGISATALLYSLLRMVDADACYHIPDRLKDGYGIKPGRLRQAASDGVKLLITVDCGISSFEEIRLANELGMEVIVTDHHEPAEELPPAFAVINPKRSDCPYPFRDLAGVGVAFKFGWAVAQSFSPTKKVSEEFRTFLLDALALVALGTVADVVPLRDENRVFAKFGLKALEATTNPGLRALLERTGLAGSRLRASHIAFRMAPRINAAGRMGRASLGMDLLTASSTREAEEVAAELERENRNRQKVGSDILNSALECLEEKNIVQEKVILLAREGWHPGVTGIVASKLTDRFNRPVVLIAVNGETGKGTARSVAGVDLYELLKSCSGNLIGFGGHALAAGFEIYSRDIEGFSLELASKADSAVSGEMLQPVLEADLAAPLTDLTVYAVREFDRLRPHGEGNPEPVFISDGVYVAGRPRAIGRDGSHLSMHLRAGDAVFRAVGFSMVKEDKLLDRLEEIEHVSIAYVPVINSWRGADTVELELRDIAVDGVSLVHDGG
jgi:single-stranded-DNA-specific exonuclease